MDETQTDILRLRRCVHLCALCKRKKRNQYICCMITDEQDIRLAGAPSTINPTRRLGGPSFKCFNTCAAPMKSPFSRRSLPMDMDYANAWTVNGSEHAPINHVRPASTGDVFSSMSFPYRHKPASKRRLSRAPRPAS